MHKILSTGSAGNAVMYHGCILVDCGVPYSVLKPFVKQIQVVFLTHTHKDHINIDTLKKLSFERPAMRFGCCEWMLEVLHDNKIRNVDLLTFGQISDYGLFQICPVKLYHDVPNCGYRIFKDGTKIFHATDTAHLAGITAKDYDLYCIESNYDEDTVFDIIAEKEARGEFAHQKGSINTHLSEQQAREFISANRKPESQVVRLHETSIFRI